jgi:undecaprenyl-diphosphatase
LNLVQIVVLAVIQGAAELLPVSSSAHVIVAEKLMGLDPSAPEMTFLLVMLHTGTMFSVLLFFWSRWKRLNFQFLKMTLLATAVTGVVGLGLKKFIEKVVLEHFLGESHAEIEMLFKSMPLVACSLFSVGILIAYAGIRESRNSNKKRKTEIEPQLSARIGLVQGLCLPFRGFSRSGATISTAILSGLDQNLAEDFSFALAVWLTPPVIVLELHRLMKAHALSGLASSGQSLTEVLSYGALGMVFSFGAGLLALRWLSSWLASSRWKYFGFYCILMSFLVFSLR